MRWRAMRDAKLTTTVRGVNPAYFAQRGLKVIDGRDLTDEDVQARRAWPSSARPC